MRRCGIPVGMTEHVMLKNNLGTIEPPSSIRNLEFLVHSNTIMSTHLPIRAFRPLSRQCLRQRPLLRPFSTTPFLQARKRHVDPALKEVAVRNHAIKSQKTIDEAQLSDQRNFPDDIGLLPGISCVWTFWTTFILIFHHRDLCPLAAPYSLIAPPFFATFDDK